METFTYLVLVPMVYLAFAVFIIGSVWRVFRIITRPSFAPTLKIYPERKPAWLYALSDTFLMPTVLRHNVLLWLVLMSFHVAVALLILGHLELFAEIGFLQIWPHQIFLGAGWVGFVVLAALLVLLFRRVLPPAKDLSVAEDYLLLILLFLTALFGAQMHWARRFYDYFSMDAPEYREYLMSLLTFQPSIESVQDAGHSFMLVMHVFFANLFIMFFPFSKMMHSMFSLPVNKLRRG